MNDPRVLCLGEVLWDCLADQPVATVEQVQSWTKYPGGAPANVACALAKLGIDAGFVGCIGGDNLGEQLAEILRSHTVNTTGIQRSLKHPTRQVEVLRSSGGDRQFAGFMGRNTTEFADAYLHSYLLPVGLFHNAEFLVTGTLGFAYPETRKAIERSWELADQHYLKIFMDVNWRPMFWPDPNEAKSLIQSLVHKVDFLKVSEEEADWLFQTTDPGAIAHRLDQVEGVLISLGADGCAYCLSQNEGKVPAFKVEVEDTTGAGDAFVAGFLSQLCQFGIPALSNPETARQMVTYANAVGALATTRPGAIAAQPKAIEVDAFLYLNQIQEPWGVGSGE
ncbi:MAG: carbohydrate kinase [Oculatellaceae cyanobacterium Prado106]|jgi:fructokinase|nr:carbohydrate kinase [Oculatellaceae cyanobacterium Prado106]